MSGINIPFSFPVDPNAEELEELISRLIEETNALRKSMMDLPIDQLNEKKRQYIKVLSDASLETMKLNQNQKDEQKILLDISKTVEIYIDKIDNCIKLQKLFAAEGDKAQKMLDSYSKEMITATKNISAFKDKISALNKIQEEGGRLTSAQEKQLISYGDKIKLLGKSIEDNTLLLDIYYGKVKDGTAIMQGESGVIESLTEQIKLLKKERAQLTEEEIASGTVYQDLTKQIADMTNMLAVYNKEASGQLEVEAQLNKVRETNIILENKTIALAEVDIEIKAKQVVANNELSDAVKKRVAELTGADIKEAELAYNVYLKEKELGDKKLANEEARLIKTHRAREIAYEKMWLQAEKNAAKEAAQAEKSSGLFGNFGQIFERMGLRMVASLIWWSLIIGAATALYEWMTKIDEATERANEKIKDYLESFKSIQKALENSKNETLSNIFFDKSEAKTQKEILEDKATYNVDQRYQAYQKLNQIAPKVLDDLNYENFLRAEGNERMKEQLKNLDLYIEKNDKLSIIKKNQKDDEKAILDNLDAQQISRQRISDALTRQFGRKLSNSEEEKIIKSQGSTLHTPGEGKLQEEITNLTNERLELKQLQANRDRADSDRDTLEKEISGLEGNVKHPRGRKGPKDHRMQDALYEAREQHGDFIQDIRSNFDATKKSFHDKADMYESDLSETQRYYDEQISIIDKFGKASGESEMKLQGRRLQALREKKLAENKTKEDGQRDLLEMKKYNEEQIKIIDDTNREIEDRFAKHKRSIEDLDKDTKKGASGKRKAGRVNLLGAFFGNNGDTPVEDFKESIKDRDDVIEEDQNNLSSSGGRLNKADIDIFYKQQQIDKDNETLDSNKSPEELLDTTRHLEEFKKLQNEKSQITSQVDKDTDKLKIDQDEKEIALKQRKKDNEIKIAQETLIATEKIANSGFELQKKRIQNQMNNVQGLAAFEMTIAGNNSSAKIRIAQREHAEMLALKRKEAQVEKSQALFNAGLNLGKGVTAALAVDPPYGFILAGLVAAAEIKAAADISNAPLPSYAKGRKGGKKELARINEEGLELVERGGRMTVLGGGKDGIVNLEHGDIVHTHKESMKILEANNFLNTLIRGTGIINKRDDIEKHQRQTSFSTISKSDMQDVMDSAVKKIPQPVTILPAQDVQDRHQRQQLRNGL